MKRLLSILVVLSYVLLSVVFAEGAFADPSLLEDGEGLKPMAPALACEAKGTNYKWVVGTGTELGECVTGDSFCSGKSTKTNKLIWNPDLRSCVDENSQQGTLLPNTTLSESECEVIFNADAQSINLLKDFLSGKTGKDNLTVASFTVSKLSVLGCAIKTGRVRIWMIPYFIKYFIQFALVVAGLVAVGAMVVGGYLYLFSALIDDKEKGKRAIIYGLGGFVLALLSWALVNIVIALATR